MRLEQKHRRRAVAVISLRLVAHRLRHDPRLLGIGRRRRMIDVVRVFQRVRQHKARVQFAVDVDQPFHMRFVKARG